MWRSLAVLDAYKHKMDEEASLFVMSTGQFPGTELLTVQLSASCDLQSC